MHAVTHAHGLSDQSVAAKTQPHCPGAGERFNRARDRGASLGFAWAAEDTGRKFLGVDTEGVPGPTIKWGRKKTRRGIVFRVCYHLRREREKGRKYACIWLLMYRILLEADNITCFQRKELRGQRYCVRFNDQMYSTDKES